MVRTYWPADDGCQHKPQECHCRPNNLEATQAVCQPRLNCGTGHFKKQLTLKWHGFWSVPNWKHLQQWTLEKAEVQLKRGHERRRAYRGKKGKAIAEQCCYS